jgi:plasmid maintenance system antidote protein VapI
MNYQVMPDMAQDEYDALKEDIAERGVMVPIEFDENGNVLDGHHRLKICAELGIDDYPKIVRAGMSESEKWTHARKLNMARRHLTREQRRELIREQIKDTPELSDRQIAKMLGVSNSTVSVIRSDLIENGQVCDSHTSMGADGKEYKRHHKSETLDKYAFFTVDDYYSIRERIRSVTDADKLKEIIRNLSESQNDVAEAILEATRKVSELTKDSEN